jgi:hypothetical protein
MKNILERVAHSGQSFVPYTPAQFLALQIARKLGALDRAREYAILLEHYPEKIIANAFHACWERGDPNHDSFLHAFRAIIHQPDP